MYVPSTSVTTMEIVNKTPLHVKRGAPSCTEITQISSALPDYFQQGCVNLSFF